MNNKIHVLIMSLILTACTNQATPISNQASPDIRQLWLLNSVPAGLPVPEGAYLDLRSDKVNHVYLGCNQLQFDGQFNATTGSLKANHVSSTRMACPDFGELEFYFAQALQAGMQTKLKHHILFLQDSTGKEWQFKRIL